MEKLFDLFTMIVDLSYETKDGKKLYKNLLNELWFRTIRGDDHYRYGSFLGFDIYNWKYRFKDNTIELRLYSEVGGDTNLNIEGITIIN